MKCIKIITSIIVMGCCGVNNTFAQHSIITGKILKEGTNEPIIGASVSVKGTTRGTITDHTGQYVLNVKISTSTLIIEYKNMKTIEKEIDTHGMLKVTVNFEMINKYNLVKILTKKNDAPSEEQERLSLIH